MEEKLVAEEAGNTAEEQEEGRREEEKVARKERSRTGNINLQSLNMARYP